MVFACVIRVVRILHAKYGDIAVVACVARWKRLNAAFICGARRFLPFVSECARNAPKIWWGTDVEDFGVRKAYVQYQKLGSVTNA